MPSACHHSIYQRRHRLQLRRILPHFAAPGLCLWQSSSNVAAIEYRSQRHRSATARLSIDAPRPMLPRFEFDVRRGCAPEALMLLRTTEPHRCRRRRRHIAASLPRRLMNLREDITRREPPQSGTSR
jgi:hypothetical protein